MKKQFITPTVKVSDLTVDTLLQTVSIVGGNKEFKPGGSASFEDANSKGFFFDESMDDED